MVFLCLFKLVLLSIKLNDTVYTCVAELLLNVMLKHPKPIKLEILVKLYL